VGFSGPALCTSSMRVERGRAEKNTLAAITPVLPDCDPENRGKGDMEESDKKRNPWDDLQARTGTIMNFKGRKNTDSILNVRVENNGS